MVWNLTKLPGDELSIDFAPEPETRFFQGNFIVFIMTTYGILDPDRCGFKGGKCQDHPVENGARTFGNLVRIQLGAPIMKHWKRLSRRL